MFHSIFQFFVLKYAQFGQTSQRKTPKNIKCQDCALAMPGGLWRLNFAPGRLENLIFLFIQIICSVPWILHQPQSTGLPSIFLRAQH